jgi:hypothetical protein
LTTTKGFANFDSGSGKCKKLPDHRKVYIHSAQTILLMTMIRISKPYGPRAGFMDRLGPLFFLLLLAISLLSTGCAGIIKNYVNKKYPPVSSLDKSAEAVKLSNTELAALAEPDLGIVLSEPLLVNVFRQTFGSLYASNPTLGIPQVSRIEILDSPRYTLGQQEIISSARLRIHVKDNKWVDRFEIEFTGRTAVSIATDSLWINPSFQRVRIEKLKLKKLIILSGAAKEAINALTRSFMDNINGQIKNQLVKIDYPPLPELPLSEILGQPGLEIARNDTFRITRKILRPVIHITPGKLSLLAQVTDRKEPDPTDPPATETPLPPPPYVVEPRGGGAATVVNVTGRMPELSARSGSITPAEFKRLYDYFDSSFYSRWREQLDAVANADTTSSARLSYYFVGRVIDELFKDAAFTLKYNLDERTTFPDKQITLKDIPKPNCEEIRFECQFNNCNNVLEKCRSCKWYQVSCHAKWVACQAGNGLRYAACQTSNGAKAVWCAAELVGKKALCYATIAGIFLYDNFVKNVGRFGGGATAQGNIRVDVNKITPGGLNVLTLDGRINASVNAAVDLRFSPAGVLGHLACIFPISETVRLNNIRVQQAYQLNADMEKVTDGADVLLRIKMRSLPLAIQFANPLLLELLRYPRLVLSCSIGIFLGTTIGSVLALTGNEDFKNYMRAALFGSYRLDIQENFNVKMPHFKVENSYLTHEFKPSWGGKSIIYQ